MWPQVITGVVGNVLNALINYIFLYPLELGVPGSAAANSISQYSLALLLFIYIYWRGLHKATWGGWSIDCLHEWGDFVRLAIPSMFMICLEWWTLEIGEFLAGLISEVELGAQSIVYQLSSIAYMVPQGFTVAATVRVGNALGAGNVEQAKLSCKVPIICIFTVACVVGASLSISRNVIGYIFTTEQDILQRVGEVVPLLGFFHIAEATSVRNSSINILMHIISKAFLDIFLYTKCDLTKYPQGVAAGVLRGAGKPLFGALCNLVGFYIIGLPTGASLMFAANMGIVGLWTGLVICLTLRCIVFIIFFCKLDWKKAVEEALVRAGVQNAEEKEKELEQTDLNQKQASVTTTTSSCVSAEEGGTDLEEHDPDHSQLQSTTTTTTTTTVGDVLSVPQLVLRRGLALLVMVVILVAGIISSDLLVRLLKE
ncbi:multidrug and toxin extrusion protein 1-like isoform X3 [Scomber japonicus]|nr:multidrug and toxin extrusion protein 1-like isoform X3 [Scomber japonicus]